MQNRIALALVVGVALVAMTPGKAEPVPTLRERVLRLGEEKNDNFAAVRALAEHPRESCEYLVDALQPIAEVIPLGQEEKPACDHTLWCLRALRYLTGGLDFYGKSGHHFGQSEDEQNRKYWLSLTTGSEDKLAFFAMWPSRGRIYVAPLDAQKAIIEQWRDWYKSKGHAFVYKPLNDPSPGKWLW